MQQGCQSAAGAGSSWRSRLAMVVLACTVVGSGVAYGQSAPDPRGGASTPVQVMNTPTNPVPVTGTVSGEVTLTNGRIDTAVLNDTLNQPYMVSRSGSFVDDDAPWLDFDVPDGKRLIVETITVRFALSGPGAAVMQFSCRQPSGTNAFGEIALQPHGTIVDAFGRATNWIVGTHAMTLRIDAAPGSTDELRLVPRVPVMAGTLNVLVAGYLVPIP